MEQSVDWKALADIQSLPAHDVHAARHRRLLEDANAALAASPAPALLERVQTIHRILLAANPEALRGSVGWIGRLLGRDIVLQAESEALRSELGVHVMQARQQLAAIAEHVLQLQVLGVELHSAIKGIDQQSVSLAGGIVTGDNNSDSTRQLQYLTTLAVSSRITASQIELILLNQRELIQRIDQMLPHVELLLDQQRLLQTGMDVEAACQAATNSLEALQDHEHINLTIATHADVTPR